MKKMTTETMYNPHVKTLTVYTLIDDTVVSAVTQTCFDGSHIVSDNAQMAQLWHTQDNREQEALG